MRVRSVLILSALLAATTVAAADPPHETPRDKALMLYFSKSFGSTQRQARTPFAFGLRLQQSAPFDSARSFALVDARYSPGGTRLLAFAGVPALSLGSSEDDSSGDLSAGSSGQSSVLIGKHPGWTAVMVAVAVLGGACLFELGICEDDKRPYESPAPTTGPR